MVLLGLVTDQGLNYYTESRFSNRNLLLLLLINNKEHCRPPLRSEFKIEINCRKLQIQRDV